MTKIRTLLMLALVIAVASLIVGCGSLGNVRGQYGCNTCGQGYLELTKAEMKNGVVHKEWRCWNCLSKTRTARAPR